MMKHFELSKLCTLVALLILASIFVTLSARSVWMDEAMLLKNIIAISNPADFAAPCPTTTRPSRYWHRYSSSS